MPHCLVDLSFLGVPDAGAMMQTRHIFPAYLLQPMAQRLSKKGLVAIPAAASIERHHKYIGSLQGFQQFLTASPLHDRIT